MTATVTPTPSGIPQILGGFASIAAALDYAAQGDTGLNFYATRGELITAMSYAELRARALIMAGKLANTGLEQGDRVALIAETGPDFPVAFFACQYAGLVPCPTPFTSYMGGRDAYVERLVGMLEACSAKLLIVPDSVATILGDTPLPGEAQLLTFAGLANRDEQAFAPVEPHEVAYIQFSSGSTAQPKGIVITQAALSANVTGILRHGMRLNPEDRAFSWLPFYHDMGLVGFLLAPMFGQCTVDYLPAAGFVRRPSLWLRLMAENRSSISYAPSFGYNLAAERFRADEHGALDLSAWRIAGIGGDMIRAEILQRFAEQLRPTGFRPEAFLPSYGMAEATLAITFANEGQGLTPDHPGEAAGRGFVVCGRPLPGHEIRIVDDHGAPVADLSVGHIFVRGPSLMHGYLDRPELTAMVMQPDGFMATGDKGYLRDGNLVVTGRAKDLILRNGRNIWPDDIEHAAETAAGLGHGNVVAFPVEDPDGIDRIIVLMQLRDVDAAAGALLRTRIATAVSQAEGVDCMVVLVPSRTIPMTSSGKLQRRAARDAYLAKAIAAL